tara:strand:- start:1169 stop:1456 length:288 start_codon:yes stop_codon:yes gene_type:complete
MAKACVTKKMKIKGMKLNVAVKECYPNTPSLARRAIASSMMVGAAFKPGGEMGKVLYESADKAKDEAARKRIKKRKTKSKSSKVRKKSKSSKGMY